MQFCWWLPARLVQADACPVRMGKPQAWDDSLLGLGLCYPGIHFLMTNSTFKHKTVPQKTAKK